MAAKCLFFPIGVCFSCPFWGKGYREACRTGRKQWKGMKGSADAEDEVPFDKIMIKAGAHDINANPETCNTLKGVPNDGTCTLDLTADWCIQQQGQWDTDACVFDAHQLSYLDADTPSNLAARDLTIAGPETAIAISIHIIACLLALFLALCLISLAVVCKALVKSFRGERQEDKDIAKCVDHVAVSAFGGYVDFDDKDVEKGEEIPRIVA